MGRNRNRSTFQGLEPLPQILNKLGRNKKLNPSSRNAKGKAWFLCKIVGTAYFQTRKWPLCYRLIPDTTTPPGSSGPSTPKQKRYFSGLILHLHGTQSCILNKKRTKYNLEKQRSSPNWPVIMTPSRNAPGPLWPSNFQAKMLLFKVDFASAWYTIMHFKQKTHRIKPWKTAFYLNLTGHHDAIP